MERYRFSMNQELVFYIKEQLKAGYPKETIREALMLHGGWHADEVNEAFKFIAPPVSAAPAAKAPVASAAVSDDLLKAARVSANTPPTNISNNPASVYEPTVVKTTPDFIGNSVQQIAPRKKSYKKAAVIAMIIILLGLGGVGAYAYMTFLKPDPAAVIAKMATTLASSTSAHYAFDVSVKTPDSHAFDLAFDVSVDTHDSTHLASIGTVTISTDIPSSIHLVLSTIFAGGTLYVQMPDAAPIAQFLNIQTGLPKTGDWIQIRESDILKVISETDPSQGGLSISPFLSTMMQSAVSDKLFALTVPMPDTALANESVHDYQFTLSKENLKISIGKALAALSGTNAPIMSSDAVSAFVDNMQFSGGEVWIGKYDFLPKKSSFSLSMMQDGGTPISADVTLSAKDYNVPVSISAPAAATSLADVIDAAEQASGNAVIQNMLSTVPAAAEIYYSKKHSYAGICGAANGLVPILNVLEPVIAPDMPTCFDSAKAYAIESSLLGPLKNYSCIDSSGADMATANILSSTVCK